MLYFNKLDVSERIDEKYTKCFISIELTFLKELIRQVHQKSVIFVTICYFLDKGFKFQPHWCHNGCHNVLMMSVNFNDIAILNINNVDYCCIINGFCKSETVSLLQKGDLNEKSGASQNIMF